MTWKVEYILAFLVTFCRGNNTVVIVPKPKLAVAVVPAYIHSIRAEKERASAILPNFSTNN